GARAIRFEGRDACYQSVLSVHRNSQDPAALTIRHAELGISNTELQSTIVFENPAIREATMHLAADASWIRLFIRVNEGRIVESRCNDIALPALVTDLASSNTAGPGHCGVFVRRGSATFSDFTLSPHAPAAST
ncbi:MAG: hypothetical protein O2931_12255, partial [Planctomycetota bacterium]|nr:hypothetical protein [Planctomycetota bacterium]